MNSNKIGGVSSRQWIGLWFVYVLSLLGFTFMIPNLHSINMSVNENFGFYVYLLIAYALTVGLFVFCVYQKNVDIFEPYYMFMIMSILLYTVAPMVYIINDDTLLYGKYVMDGSIKGTTVYLVAILFFNLGYFSISRIKYNYIERKDTRVYATSDSKVIMYLMMWIVCFILYMLYALGSGKSVLYILSYGMLGSGTSSNISGNALVKFVLNFGYCMVPLCLYIFYYSRNKMCKFTVLFLTISSFYINGYRFIIVVLLYALFMMHYILKMKRPKVKTLIGGIIAILLLVTLIGITREGVRNGAGVKLTEVGFDSILAVLDKNFDIYQVYYAIMAATPSANMPFTLGRALIIDPLIMFIPRALWTAKPGGIVLQYVAEAEGSGALAAAMAPPYMPELYIEFGIIGVVVIMFLVGRGLAKSVNLYRSETLNIDNIITYCTIASYLFQFIIRGYFASNFWMIVFPLLTIKIGKILGNNFVKVSTPSK